MLGLLGLGHSVISGTSLVPALGIPREAPSSVSSPPRSSVGSHLSPFLGTGLPVDGEGCSLSLTAPIVPCKSVHEQGVWVILTRCRLLLEAGVTKAKKPIK